jgi:hypothetical protein
LRFFQSAIQTKRLRNLNAWPLVDINLVFAKADFYKEKYFFIPFLLIAMKATYFKKAARRSTAFSSVGESPLTPPFDAVAFQEQPITKARQALWLASPDAWSPLWKRLAILDKSQQPVIERIQALPADTLTPADVNLYTPEQQLAWALKLRVASHELAPAEVRTTPVFNAIVTADATLTEMRRFASLLANDPFFAERYTIAWGAPGSWFWCNSELSHINLDPFFTLLVGFEHSRALAMHEILHAELSAFFPPSMETLATRANALLEKGRQQGLAPHEYARLQSLVQRHQRRKLFFNSIEDARVNTMLRRRNTLQTQDFASSLNHFYALSAGVGEKRDLSVNPYLPGDVENTAYIAFYLFLAENGLFSGTPDAFRAWGFDPEAVLLRDNPEAPPLAGFESLRESLLGHEGVTRLLPSLDLRFMPEIYREHAQRASRQASLVIDALWRRHIDDDSDLRDIAPDDEAHEETRASADQGADSESPPSPGESAETEAKTSPQEAPSPGEQAPDDAPAIHVHGEGDKPGFSPLPQTPAEEHPRAPSEKPADAKRLEEWQEPTPKTPPVSCQALRESLDRLRGSGQNGLGPGDAFNDLRPAEPEGQHSAYLDLVHANSASVHRLKRLLLELQKKRELRLTEQAKRPSCLVPEDGDLNRFDRASYLQRRIKEASGDRVILEDFEHYHDDATTRVVVPPTDLALIIDWSGSMEGWPIRAAVNMGTSLYEAAKAIRMNVSVILMGDRQPLIVARPGERSAEIGAKIEGIRSGLGGDRDHVAPAIAAVLDKAAVTRGARDGYVGNTHIVIISDGFFSDLGEALPKIGALVRTCPNLTIDALLIGETAPWYAGITFPKLCDDVNATLTTQPLGYVSVGSESDVEAAMVAVLKKRLNATTSEEAVPLRQKSRLFRKALHAFER